MERAYMKPLRVLIILLIGMLALFGAYGAVAQVVVPVYYDLLFLRALRVEVVARQRNKPVSSKAQVPTPPAVEPTK